MGEFFDKMLDNLALSGPIAGVLAVLLYVAGKVIYKLWKENKAIHLELRTTYNKDLEAQRLENKKDEDERRIRYAKIIAYKETAILGEKYRADECMKNWNKWVVDLTGDSHDNSS